GPLTRRQLSRLPPCQSGRPRPRLRFRHTSPARRTSSCSSADCLHASLVGLDLASASGTPRPLGVPPAAAQPTASMPVWSASTSPPLPAHLARSAYLQLQLSRLPP